MTIEEALAAADLGAAIEAATAKVKSAPGDHEARRVLIDLDILAERFEAADKQADVLSRIAPDLAVGMSLLRGRLRAARARSEWFANGAVPSFTDGPTERDEIALQLAVAARAGEPVDALVERLDGVSETELEVNGPRAACRDADGGIPHALEVLATDGSYLWVDLATVARAQFAPVHALRDLAWRRVDLELTDGSQTDVIVCATYHSGSSRTDEHRLARLTDWSEENGITRGIGQKILLVGDDAIDALDLERIAS